MLKEIWRPTLKEIHMEGMSKEEDSIGDDVASKELEDMKRCQK